METGTYGAALIAIATFAFLGSSHCALMCGPLAASCCSGSDGPQSLGHRLTETLLYHATRLMAYTVLGVVVGLSSALFLTSYLKTFAPFLGVTLGIIMFAYATFEFARIALTLLRKKVPQRPTFFGHPSGVPTLLRSLLRSPLPRPISLGLATALLPCGFLYAALAQAALLAHPFFSGAAMFVFAFATGPALLFGSALLAGLQKRYPIFAPLMMAFTLLASSAALLQRALAEPHVHNAAQHGGHHS